jgi:hypothetical protein
VAYLDCQDLPRHWGSSLRLEIAEPYGRSIYCRPFEERRARERSISPVGESETYHAESNAVGFEAENESGENHHTNDLQTQCHYAYMSGARPLFH